MKILLPPLVPRRTIAVLLPENQAEGLNRYLLRYEELHCRWPSPFEGIPEVLASLRAKRLFIGLITGKGNRSTELTLKNYGLGNYFDVIKTGASSGPVKDQRIEEVIEEFSLEPQRDIVCRRCSQRCEVMQRLQHQDRRGSVGADRQRG